MTGLIANMQIPDGQDGHQKLLKVKQLLDILIPRFVSEYDMHKECSVTVLASTIHEGQAHRVEGQGVCVGRCTQRVCEKPASVLWEVSGG